MHMTYVCVLIVWTTNITNLYAFFFGSPYAGSTHKASIKGRNFSLALPLFLRGSSGIPNSLDSHSRLHVDTSATHWNPHIVALLERYTWNTPFHTFRVLMDDFSQIFSWREKILPLNPCTQGFADMSPFKGFSNITSKDRKSRYFRSLEVMFRWDM